MKFVPAERGELLQRSTVKGIVKMISDNRAKKKMEKFRSRKAILVSQYISAACHTQFICKGHIAHPYKVQARILFSIAI
uniref:Uncharacterized protein n=1 Tax=Brassica oleracea TaxID=3712 RepID=A0A3P6GSL0_BRAOL|nr:unnamed protein product [Brassica oleracea]